VRTPAYDLSLRQWTAAILLACLLLKGYPRIEVETNLDTLALGQTDPWFLSADDEAVMMSALWIEAQILESGYLHVILSRSELIVDCILDVNNVEATVVTFPVCNDTNTTHVTTTGCHRNDTRVELDKVGDLASC